MKKAVIALATLAVAPAAAFASDFNYNYFDGAVAFTEQDNNVDSTEFNFEYRSDLDASAVANTPDSVGTFWHAGLNLWTLDDIDADYSDLFGGVGIYTAVNPALDLGGYADLQYATYEVDTPFGTFDDSELALRIAGFGRFAATDALDIEGGVTHSTAFDGYTDLYARGMFAVSPEFQLGGGLRLGDSGDGFEVRARYNF
ncbi:MAG: hypothetical protein R3270_03080 [Gammaproteobacteria bacterium]|nr:hypothetical protein [Gammaproteobacteria bacterium]